MDFFVWFFLWSYRQHIKMHLGSTVEHCMLSRPGTSLTCLILTSPVSRLGWNRGVLSVVLSFGAFDVIAQTLRNTTPRVLPSALCKGLQQAAECSCLQAAEVSLCVVTGLSFCVSRQIVSYVLCT